MLARTFFALLFGMQVGASSNKVFIPMSAALDVAKKVGISEGYSLADRIKFFFDLMIDKENKPVFPGYVRWAFTGTATSSVRSRSTKAQAKSWT